MFAKSRLREIESYVNCFVTEDLTTLISYQNFGVYYDREGQMQKIGKK